MPANLSVVGEAAPLEAAIFDEREQKLLTTGAGAFAGMYGAAATDNLLDGPLSQFDERINAIDDAMRKDDDAAIWLNVALAAKDTAPHIYVPALEHSQELQSEAQAIRDEMPEASIVPLGTAEALAGIILGALAARKLRRMLHQ